MIWFEILLLLNICHLLADFTWLSTSKMLNAKKFGTPLLPILLHAGVHGILQTIVVWTYTGGYWQLALLIGIIQTITHFIIDIWKGRMNGWFPILQQNTNYWYWSVFGIDQYLHQAILILQTKLLVDW